MKKKLGIINTTNLEKDEDLLYLDQRKQKLTNFIAKNSSFITKLNNTNTNLNNKKISSQKQKFIKKLQSFLQEDEILITHFCLLANRNVLLFIFPYCGIYNYIFDTTVYNTISNTNNINIINTNNKSNNTRKTITNLLINKLNIDDNIFCLKLVQTLKTKKFMKEAVDFLIFLFKNCDEKICEKLLNFLFENEIFDFFYCKKTKKIVELISEIIKRFCNKKYFNTNNILKTAENFNTNNIYNNPIEIRRITGVSTKFKEKNLTNSNESILFNNNIDRNYKYIVESILDKFLLTNLYYFMNMKVLIEENKENKEILGYDSEIMQYFLFKHFEEIKLELCKHNCSLQNFSELTTENLLQNNNAIIKDKNLLIKEEFNENMTLSQQLNTNNTNNINNNINNNNKNSEEEFSLGSLFTTSKKSCEFDSLSLEEVATQQDLVNSNNTINNNINNSENLISQLNSSESFNLVDSQVLVRQEEENIFNININTNINNINNDKINNINIENTNNITNTNTNNINNDNTNKNNIIENENYCIKIISQTILNLFNNENFKTDSDFTHNIFLIWLLNSEICVCPKKTHETSKLFKSIQANFLDKFFSNLSLKTILSHSQISFISVCCYYNNYLLDEYIILKSSEYIKKYYLTLEKEKVCNCFTAINTNTNNNKYNYYIKCISCCLLSLLYKTFDDSTINVHFKVSHLFIITEVSKMLINNTIKQDNILNNTNNTNILINNKYKKCEFVEFYKKNIVKYLNKDILGYARLLVVEKESVNYNINNIIGTGDTQNTSNENLEENSLFDFVDPDITDININKLNTNNNISNTDISNEENPQNLFENLKKEFNNKNNTDSNINTNNENKNDNKENKKKRKERKIIDDDF